MHEQECIGWYGSSYLLHVFVSKLLDIGRLIGMVGVLGFYQNH